MAACLQIQVLVIERVKWGKALTLFKMGGGTKGPPPPLISFSFVTSTNIGISQQNFLTFRFNPFATLL